MTFYSAPELFVCSSKQMRSAFGCRTKLSEPMWLPMKKQARHHIDILLLSTYVHSQSTVAMHEHTPKRVTQRDRAKLDYSKHICITNAVKRPPTCSSQHSSYLAAPRFPHLPFHSLHHSAKVFASSPHPPAALRLSYSEEWYYSN